MLGWFKKVWILISLTNCTTNLLSMFSLLIFFNAHINPVSLCLQLWYQIPGDKYLSKFTSPQFSPQLEICHFERTVFRFRRSFNFGCRTRFAKRDCSWGCSWNWLFLLFFFFGLVEEHHGKEIVVWLNCILITFLEFLFVGLAAVEHFSFEFLIRIKWDSFFCFHCRRTQLDLVVAGFSFFVLVSELIQTENKRLFVVFFNLFGRAVTYANGRRIRLDAF